MMFEVIGHDGYYWVARRVRFPYGNHIPRYLTCGPFCQIPEASEAMAAMELEFRRYIVKKLEGITVGKDNP